MAPKKFVYGEHTGDYINIQGLNIHFIASGDGDPVLLVHGIGQSAYTWRHNFPELSKYFFTVAPDMIGFGYSDKPDLSYTIEEYSEFLLAFMNAMRIKQAHMIGMGIGAVYVLDFVIHYPDRVGKVVCISPGSITRDYPLKIQMLRNSFLSNFAKLTIGENTVRRILKDSLFDQTCLKEEDFEEYFAPLDSREAKEVLRRSVFNFDDEEVLSKLRLINNKTMFVWGSEDRWHPIEYSSDYTAPVADSILLNIRNCGHLVHEEKPAKFNQEVIKFLLE